MSALQNNQFLLASGSPTDPTFPVQRSVRLRSSASAYFNRTPASAGNRKTWTWSGWVKRGILGSTDRLFCAGSGSTYTEILTASDTIKLNGQIAGADNGQVSTVSVFRDPSAWYHLVVAFDVTATTKIIVYINGVSQTLTTTTAFTNQNYEINNTVSHNVGNFAPAPASGDAWDGYLTEVNFIDGQALIPTSFGGYNSGTGVWEPRKYTGTYGTNGFYLNFQDNSGATATTIGKDSSGNGNNWTPNNISVTAGVTYDSMLDVPTNTSPTNANFAVGNPLNADGSTWSGGNLNFSLPNSTNNAQGTVSVTSGKWYWEVVYSAQANGTGVQEIGLRTRWTSGVVYAPDGTKYVNGTSSAYGATYAVGDIIGVALDMDGGTVTFYKNNTSQGSISLSGSGCVNATFTTSAGGGSTSTGSVNFGQRPFSYTPPSGFKSLNTYNLPDPTIASGDDYHKVYTYTGNGGGLQVGEIQKPASLFNLDRSLRLRSSNSAYLSRTPASAGNRQKWTWSAWVKKGTIPASGTLFAASITAGSSEEMIQFTGDVLQFFDGSTGVLVVCSNALKDPTMWYHIMIAYDSTLATQADRGIFYVNGVRQTATTTAIGLNRNSAINNTVAHGIGRFGSLASGYFDGYLADVYFIDGQQLTPTDFGAYDGNYYWTPKAYTGTYGTNGWHLEFEDFSAATAAAIGKDTSGNVNNWTPSGISVTAGATYDSMTDVPTLTSSTTANYCVINPLGIGVPSFKNATSLTISNGNLSYSKPSATGYFGALGTFATPPTGKWYWEFTPTTNVITCGISVSADYASSGEFGVRVDNTTILVNGSSVQTGLAGLAVNDVIGCAWNAGSNSFQFYKNGSTYGTAVPFTPASNASYYPYLMNQGTGISVVANANFGQRPFAYTPPTGFKELNSLNIAEVTDDLESPDFVWIKSRSAATGHALFNSVTGVGKYLSSNATTAETTDVNSLIQFNKNGFLLGNAAIVNTSAATYVASAWKAGGAAVTNTAGSITSQVSANQKAGFSIVTYTGTGANATVGHGLGIAPRMIIIKNRTTAGLSWIVYHASLSTPATQALYLNTTDSVQTSALYWNNTAPTSSVFSIAAYNPTNQSTNQIVAYCFSEIAGFSKFGSYTGTGNSDGAFVYTGFRPRWIMTKQTGAISNWSIHDTSRAPYNLTINELYSDTADAEYTGTNDSFDLLSNGFKPRSAGTPTNASGGTYIYVAFAENPFKYSLAR